MSGGLYSTEGRDFDQTLDLKKIKPYGDTMNDGKTQLSFTLPVPAGDEAIEAAKQLMKKMGFENPQVVFHRELTAGYTFFNCYGSCTHTVDYSNIHVPKVESTKWDMAETDSFIREQIGRPIVVIGASTGTDAHTVGIDAIMNMKGFAGHYGLERYEMFEALNMGSQVTNEEFIAKAIETQGRRPAGFADGDPEGHSYQRTSRSWSKCSKAEGLRDKSDSGVRRPAHLARTGQRAGL